MFYSGKALGPWVQLNLGAERTILAIEIYGHRAEPKCDLNLLDESFWSPLCDGSNPSNPSTQRTTTGHTATRRSKGQ